MANNASLTMQALAIRDAPLSSKVHLARSPATIH